MYLQFFREREKEKTLWSKSEKEHRGGETEDFINSAGIDCNGYTPQSSCNAELLKMWEVALTIAGNENIFIS